MVTIAAVVPTRNRPRHAMDAVRSLLDQDARIEIFLCDNSISPVPLRDFCRDRPRVTYLRPDRELAMGKNWDWAIREAMARSSATHLAVHYDRKHSKAGSWDRLAAIAARRPDLLISFAADAVTCQPPPLRLWQTPWTGKIFSIETARIARLIAGGCVTQLAHALPVLSNCLVPRAILQSVIDEFGDVCDSGGPDGAFVARFLALQPRYIHYDRAQGILYGSHRSNGLGYLRGSGGDYADFRRMIGDVAWLNAAPVPGISLGNNMLYHEYELVRRVVGDRLPPIDRAAALRDLGRELRWIADRRLKRRLREILIEHGWTGPEPEPLPPRTRQDARRERTIWSRLRRHGEMPATITGFTFRDDETALLYALRYPRLPQETHEHLDPLGAVELTAEEDAPA